MHLFCIDVGTGTQDVIYVDTEKQIENAVQMVLPSPTIRVAAQINAATRAGEVVLLVGDTMGGGPSTGALKEHLAAGLKAYAVPEAALSFCDHLTEVSDWGVNIVSQDQAGALAAATRVEMTDISLTGFETAFANWGIKFEPDVVAVAVLDHGTAAPGESQRRSRFSHLEALLERDGGLGAFVFTAEDIPPHFTRMQAVAKSIGAAFPQVVMDTGVAAVIGTSLDPVVARQPHRLSINLGNSHTTAFLLDGSDILGFFEHHTHSLSANQIDVLLENLIHGNLGADEIWRDGGHGSYIRAHGKEPFVVATGPQRYLVSDSRLAPYFAAPFGNMMLTGCYGLVKAVAHRYPRWQGEIYQALGI